MRSRNVLGVHHALLRLHVEAKWNGEVDQGSKRLHGVAGSALQQVVICIGHGVCQLQRSHRLQGVLEGQGKAQGSKRVALANLRLGGSPRRRPTLTHTACWVACTPTPRGAAGQRIASPQPRASDHGGGY
jgi:hypothetical protein